MFATTQKLSQSEDCCHAGNGDGESPAVGLRQRARRLVAGGLYRTGALHALVGAVNNWQPAVSNQGGRTFPFVKRRRHNVLQILIYHRVNDEYDPFFPATPCQVFETQMEYLSTRYSPCSLDDALAQLQAHDLPDNAVVVTFDDGYRDNFLHAYPILRRYRVPATIFLSTDAIGTDRPLWFERVFAAFRRTTQTRLREFGINTTAYPLQTVAERRNTLRHVLRFLRSVPDEERQVAVARLLDRLEVAVDGAPGLMLSWDEVRQMNEDGIAFGSHTLTHPILSQVALRKLREEVSLSKQCIEEHIGKPVTSFAYPNGEQTDFTESTKQALLEAGYRCALTTVPGVNTAGEDLFELKRATPWEHRISEFALRLAYLKWMP